MPRTPQNSGAEAISSNRRPTAFLDRDGVLNHDAGYIHKPEEFQWIEGAQDAVKHLNDAGHLVIVITNQSGVARGLFVEEDVQSLHIWINGRLQAKGAHVDAFYYCPHHPKAPLEAYRQDCDCRKPAPGMLRQAMSEWPVDPSRSFLIGDSERDITAAQAAGIPGHRFTGGNLLEMIKRIVETDGP